MMGTMIVWPAFLSLLASGLFPWEGRHVAQDVKKSAVPDSALQKQAEKVVREVLKEDYAKRNPVDRQVVVRKLLKQGMETRDDLAVKYVLLRDALEMAVQLGDCTTAWEAADQISKAYQLDAVKARTDLLDALDKAVRTQDQLKGLVGLYVRTVDLALSLDDYDQAEKAAKGWSAAARRGKDVPAVNRAEAKLKEVSELKRQDERVKKSRDALAANPNDPAANRTVGEFLCFVKGDWEAGLPLLARGDDAVLSLLAGKELGKTTEPTEQVGLGDAWWEEAVKRPGARHRIQERSIDSYKTAWPKVQGLTREKVRGRFRSFYAVPNASSPPASEGPSAWGYQDYWLDLDATLAKEGRLAAKLVPSKDPAGWSSVTTQSIPATGGREYEVAAWVLTEGTTGGDGLYVRFHTADGNFIQQHGPGMPIDQPYWTRISMKATAPPAAGRLDVSIQMTSKQGTIWLDDVSLRATGAEQELLENGSFEQIRR